MYPGNGMNCSAGIEQKNYCVYQLGMLQEAGADQTGNKTIELLKKNIVNVYLHGVGRCGVNAPPNLI